MFALLQEQTQGEMFTEEFTEELDGELGCCLATGLSSMVAKTVSFGIISLEPSTVLGI